MRLWPRGNSSLVLLLLACAIVAAVFRPFLTFDAVLLYKDIGSDSLSANYPRMLHLMRYLRSDGIPGWSFNCGMGQDLYPLSWNDPFYSVLLLFGAERLAYGVVWMEAVKIVVAALLFFLYLRRLKVSDFAATAVALGFAFSGYVILGGGWWGFSTEAVLWALLLYAFERFLQDDDWRWLPAAWGLAALRQPFFLFTFALLLAAYGTARFIDVKGPRPRELSVFALKMAAFGALGAALGGAFFLSDARQMLQTHRLSAGGLSNFRVLSSQPVFLTSGPKQLTTALLRLFSSDLMGSGSLYRGSYNYLEAPLFYCGLLSLLLAPQGLAALKPPRRRVYGTMAAAALLPSVFPYFRYAFSGFSGNYFRAYSLAVAGTLLFLSAHALDRLEKLSGRLLAGALACLLLALFAAPALAHVWIDEPLRSAAALLLCAYSVLLLAAKDSKIGRAALLALVCAEAAAFSWITVNKRLFVSADEWSSRAGYNDRTVEAVAWLKSSDPAFYRIEKDYPSSPAIIGGSFNDALAQDYYGTTEYASFPQPAYFEFLDAIGRINHALDPQERQLPGLAARTDLMSFASVRYLLSKRPHPEFTKLRTFGDVSVYRNEGWRPLGWTCGRALARTEFDKLNLEGKEKALLASCVVEDSSLAELDGLEEGKRARLEMTARGQNSIEGDISVAGRSMLFLSIPFDSGWSARVDGASAELRRVDIGFMGLTLEPGKHHIELDFVSPLRRAGTILSLLALALYAILLKI